MKKMGTPVVQMTSPPKKVRTPLSALQKKRLAIVAAVVVLLLAAAIIYSVTHRLSPSEAKAVESSREAVKGFDDKSKDYSYSQLGQAVIFAADKKCDEARAVFNDVSDHPNGVDDAYMQTINTRIEKLCTSNQVGPATSVDE